MLILKILGVFVLTVTGLLVLLVLVNYFVLTHTSKPSHTEKTALLPLFDASTTDGLVRIKANGMEFRARVAGMGNKGGEGVILLHGFPETSIMWEAVMAPLAQAGYRVVAFDQRGYSPGARPLEVGAYVIPKAVDDLFAVADAVGFSQFHLVGHDWGAAVGWVAAMAPRDRILSWTALSVPHVVAFQDALRNDPDQQKRSRYMILFRTPYVAEFIMGFNNTALMQKVMYAEMSDSQKKEYLEVFTEPGALTAALNWYRAVGLAQTPKNVEVTVPTLFIWGDHDVALGRYGVDKTAAYVKGPYKLLVLDADHWLMQEKQAEVVEAIKAHVVANSGRGSGMDSGKSK